jgi:hypothetical protein
VRVRLVRSIPNQPKESKMPEWVHSSSAWIIAHKDHVTLLSGGIQAVTAAIVAFLTIFLWQENKRLRKAGTEPEVVAYLIPDKRHLHVLMLIVTNVGRGAARNVSLEFLGDMSDLRRKGAMLPTGARLPILPVLPQDERYSRNFGNSLDFFEGGAPADFTIRVHFEDDRGRKHKTECRCSIADFEGLSRTVPAEHEAAEALKQIATLFQRWSHLDRLQVETMTSADVVNEQKARHEAALKRSEERKKQ